MVEQIRISPEEVRGYGNICEGHTLEDFIVSNSGLAKEKENVHGALTEVYKLVYSVYGLMFFFDKGNKQLYLQMSEADILSFGFDTVNKQLYLVDENDTGFNLGFDTDTNELYITDDAPPVVHNYSLALDSESYTTTGSLSVSATLLDDGVAVEGATVSFTGGDSAVTATTNSSGVATATVNFTSSGTLTASYSNVSDTASVTVAPTYLFYDSGVTGTKNDDFLCTKSSANYTLTTDNTGTVFLCSGSDGFYIPNIDIHSYSNLEVTWTFTYGTRYACHLSLLNSSKGNANSQRWHNAGTSTPTSQWYTPSGTTTITNTITVGDTMKLVKNNNTFSLYCNDELISTTTPGYDVYYIGFTSADNNRPFGYKELKILGS